MRNSLLFILIFVVFAQAAKAQNSPDCRSAIPVCADSVMTWVADGSGVIDDFDPDVIRQTGCLEKGSVSSANIENNTSWFVFRAGTDGQIGFDIEALPVLPGGSITAEWDFALYGPDVDCGAISNGTAQPIRCNYEVNSTGFTGIGVNPANGQEGQPFIKGSQNTYDEWLQVQAGEVYYLLVNNYNTNFDGDPEAFTLTFTGSSVDADQNNALDCTLRDEFLGLDIAACNGDPDIVLSALNSPAGPDIANVTWSVDFNDDGVVDQVLASGPAATTLTVSSPASGRYFVQIEPTTGGTIEDDILITFYGVPGPVGVNILDSLSDQNNVEITVLGGGSYEYSLNGGPFQDSPVFLDVPPGQNTVVVNDTNGCGTTNPIPFLVVGYPKFFTPNGDGIHDAWNVQGIETLTNPVVFIFDRYGKLLKQLDQTSPGWDGTFNGRPLPSSDYWFRLEYLRQDNGQPVQEVVRAHFSLKR
ncbi:T9SS type B sorting domain-containing protein [Robiginitalea marina]|uniref:T9SS type B sorting domain-containing protein n=1 Tax=Robiginitalea marina TaxID=2954105 RepID=A0ABT1B1P2_9FLAO|nr:T9SS type B sorting domain-containing protein [Robiginitalea marina]MCO5725894.1 T9SS type B sorting domain-containing protein [Robiginitalea marina]